MSYQVLSRKWRPQKFQEVIGQIHVTKSLQNSVLKSRLGHAYIFTGTRGIGKTSVARIFAKSLRCLNRLADANPCGVCQSCEEFDDSASMNILEMDGASNNSVDDIRSLVGNVQTLPTYGEYKVYIIDEVHMLSVSAFNALLKTLEEPPAHAVFLLATTEPHKIPDTVLSRCQRFDFKNASNDILTQHLIDICEKEGVTFETPTLPRLIAIEAQGSFRDTLSLMDQVLSFSDGLDVSEETVSIALGMAKVSSVKKICQCILYEEPVELSDVYREQLFSNVSLDNVARSLLNMLYDIIQNIDQLEQIGFSEDDKIRLNEIDIDELFWIFENLSQDVSWALSSLTPDKSLEIVLQKYAMRSQFLTSTPREQIEKKKITADIKREPLELDSVETIETPTLIEEQVEEIIKPISDIGPLPERKKEWSDFETYITKEVPAISAQLLHGNLIGESIINKDKISIFYGFSEKSKVFYDHLTQEGTKDKLQDMMRVFFKVDHATIDFEYIDKNQGFQSKAEIIEKKDKDTKEEKLSEFKNHPIIKEAEKIFGSTLDKVRIKE
jgi:DNA polymerase-3 subunit gamma/tau